MSCTAAEIQEKKRLAMERLKKTKESAQHQNQISLPSTSSNTVTVTSPGTSTKSTASFYGNEHKLNELHQHENKMQQPHQSNRILSQPYPKRDPKTTSNNAQQFMQTIEKVITCTCTMISPSRFEVIMSGYSDKLIDVFKTIPKRSYSK